MILYFFNIFFQDDIHGSKTSGNKVRASFYLEEASSKIPAVRNDDPGRCLRFKGAVAAVAMAVGVPDGERPVATGNAPVFGEDCGCQLAHHGHYLQRYFSKPFFRNHFSIRCENDDLNFCRF